jgi:hypothetical protein
MATTPASAQISSTKNRMMPYGQGLKVRFMIKAGLI